MTDIAGDALRLFIERAERLIEEKKGLQEDIRDVFAEAKGQGYDVRTMRECIKLRAIERHELEERQALLETYGRQLGLDF